MPNTTGKRARARSLAAAIIAQPLAPTPALLGQSRGIDPAPQVDATSVEFYGELPYRVADGFSAGDGYARARLASSPVFVSPMAGVGFDATSLPHEPLKLSQSQSDAYVSLGVGYWAHGFSVLAEHRRRTSRGDDERITAVYGTQWASGPWLVEPYGEAVAWWEKHARDDVADGFVRFAYRLDARQWSGFHADLLAEPYLTVSGEHLPLDNRAELRVGPRLGWSAPLGPSGAVSVSLFAQEVRGAFLRSVPAADATGRYAGRGYWTQRYLLAFGGSW